MFLLAKYGTETAIRFSMVKRGAVDLAATGNWTPVEGDTKISKDGGSFANTTNNPTAIGGTGSVGWTLTLTASELQAAEVNIQIVDAATKAVEDQYLVIYTYGNASAKIPFDMNNNCTQILGTSLTEGAGGRLAAGFKKLLDVGTPVFTVECVNQSGDSYPTAGAIKAKTDLIPASPAQQGTLNIVNASVESILEDTNMLQTDWVNGGRLDVLVDGIKAKTDKIPDVPASVGSKMDIVDNPSTAGKTALANANADAVWDEAAAAHSNSGSAGALLSLVHSILGGKQQIVDNQLICYTADGATEVAKFNLFDADGEPTMINVYLRNRV